LKRSNHFATVYVTIASILLGLALEDLVSLVREIHDRDLFVWLETIFIVHIIMNAWVGYSTIAISLNIEPIPFDAVNIFALSAAHFALNTFVGGDLGHFFLAIGIYSFVAGGVVKYQIFRASSDPAINLLPEPGRRIFVLNMLGGVYFVAVGLASGSFEFGDTFKATLLCSSMPFATLWLIMFWKYWEEIVRNSPDKAIEPDVS